MVLSAAGFGEPVSWDESDVNGEGRGVPFQHVLEQVMNNFIFKFTLPDFVWGSEEDRRELRVAGLAGKGWLGKSVQSASIAFSELEVTSCY